jgi:hypothetical protein
MRTIVGTSLFSLVLAATSIAQAAPSSVSVTPPGNARFLADQRFDIRVEGKGTGLFRNTSD